MFLQLSLVVLALAVFPVLNNAETIDTRIVGGIVSQNFIPYQVALYINGNFACGGSLITNNCVVTAAHCVKGNSVSSFTVRAGIRKLSTTGGGTRTVSKSFLPSNYDEGTLNYDVAILQLLTPINGTYIKPIALNSATMVLGDKLKVSGWGLTKETGVAVSDQLRYVIVPAISKAKCNTQYSRAITASMFCAGVPEGGKDACSGDSGGPAVKDNKLYGIVSWGNGCARANYAGVYTAVKQVLPWINKVKAANCV